MRAPCGLRCPGTPRPYRRPRLVRISSHFRRSQALGQAPGPGVAFRDVTDLRPVSAWVDEAASPRTFARTELHSSHALRRFVDGITRVMVARAYLLSSPGPDTNVVLHAIDATRPKPYRRNNAPTFVIAVAEVPEP